MYDLSDVDGLGDPLREPREVYSRSRDSRTVSDPAFARDHLGVTVQNMSETKQPPLDMSTEALKKRFVADLLADAARVREESPTTTTGEGATWDVFDPADDPPNLRR